MTTTLSSNDAALIAFSAEVGDVDPVCVAGSRTRWQLGGPVEAGGP